MAKLEGAVLDRAKLTNANLTDCQGLRFDDSRILHARLTSRPGNFFNRNLNPWFIYSPVTDPWSELRRAYTGPNFLLTLLALIAFLLPYMFQIATWRSINIAQDLMQSTLIQLEQDYQTLLEQEVIGPAEAGILAGTLESLKGVDTCLAAECQSYRIWQLLIGWNRGWQFVFLALAIIGYNMLRFYLTQAVAGFREEEERSGYTPALKEYYSPNRFGLSPTRLHVVLKVLFLVALFAFIWNLIDVLSTVVKLQV